MAEMTIANFLLSRGLAGAINVQRVDRIHLVIGAMLGAVEHEIG